MSKKNGGKTLRAICRTIYLSDAGHMSKKMAGNLVQSAGLFIYPPKHLDTFPPPDVSCFSHIHTLPFFLLSSSRVSHRTTSSHTRDHTSTPTTFQTQTSRHSPHPSTLPCFSPHTPQPLHHRFPSISSTLHPSHSSSIHKTSSLYTVSSFVLTIHFNFYFK